MHPSRILIPYPYPLSRIESPGRICPSASEASTNFETVIEFSRATSSSTLSGGAEGDVPPLLVIPVGLKDSTSIFVEEVVKGYSTDVREIQMIRVQSKPTLPYRLKYGTNQDMLSSSASPQEFSATLRALVGANVEVQRSRISTQDEQGFVFTVTFPPFFGRALLLKASSCVSEDVLSAASR